MSGSKDEFWKELMGEDFKVDMPDTPDGAAEKRQDAKAPPAQPPSPAPSPRSAPPAEGKKPEGTGLSEGFKIEYVSPDGQKREKPASDAGGVRREAPKPEGPASEPPKARPTEPPAPQARPQNQAKPQSQPQPQNQPKPQSQPQFQSRQQPKPEGGAPARRPADAANKRPRSEKAPSPDDFEVEFDFDSEYADVNEKAVRRGRTKRTGCLSGILLFLFVLSVSVVLACVGWMWTTDVLGFDGGDVPVEVTLPKSIFHEEVREQEEDDGTVTEVTVNVADIDQVADELLNKGLIRYKWLFKLFSRISHADTKVQAGTYTLNMNYDYRALIHGMNPKSGKRDTVTLTIPEGYSITQIVDLMVENNVCGRDELLDSLSNTDFDYDFLDRSTLGEPKRLEGYLFPDTYEFYIDDDPDSVIRRFLVNFQRKWEDDFDSMAESLGYTRRQILIIASMIEKEAGSDSERDRIASVIYNRLEHPDRQGTNGLLQIDATIYYAIQDTKEPFSTSYDSPYNTYLYPGLPAGPISNPGIASIRAALSPADTDYYYYALGKNGIHSFFETYEAFQKFVNSSNYGG